MPPSLSIAKAVLSCSTWTSALQSIQTLERLIGPGKIPIEAHVHSLHLLLRQQQQQQRSMSASCFDEYMEKLNSAKYESLLPHSPLLVSKPNQGLLENNAHSNNINNNNNNEAKDSVQTTLNDPHSHQHHLPSLLLLRALIPHLQRQRLDLAFETLYRWNLLSLHPVKEGDDRVDSSSSLSSTTSSPSSCSFATLIDEVDFPNGLPLAEPYSGVMQWLLNSTIREWEHEHVVAQAVAARRHRLRHRTTTTATSSSPSTAAAAAAQELSTTDEPHTTLQANLDELTRRTEHLLTLIARFAPHHERVSELTHRLLHVMMQQMQRPLSSATLFYVACRLRKAAAAAAAMSASDSLRSTADYALWIVLRRATPSFDVAFSTIQQIALQSSVSFSASTSSCCRMAPEHLELLLDRLESTGSGNHVELSAFAELVEAMMTTRGEATDHVVSPALLRRVLVACRDWRRSVNDTPMEMMWIKGHLVALWWKWRSCQNHGASLLDGMWAAHCCFPTAREKAVVYVSVLSLLSSEGDVDPQQQQSTVVSVVQQWLLGAKGSQCNDDNGSLPLPAATTTTLHDLVLESLHVVKDRLPLVSLGPTLTSSSSSSRSWDVSQLISTLVASHLLCMRDEPETDTLSTAAWLRTLTAAIQSEQQKGKPQQQRQRVLTRLLLQMRVLLEQQQRQPDASVMPQPQQQPKRERVELVLSILLAQCVESLCRVGSVSEDIRDALHQFVTAPCVASFVFGPDSFLLDVTCGLLCTKEEGEDRLLKAYGRVLRSRTTKPDLHQGQPPLLCADAFTHHLHVTKESFQTRVSQLPSASHRQTLLELRSRWLVVCTTHLLQSPSVTLHTKLRCLVAMQQLQEQHALSNESFLLQSQQRWQSWLLTQLKDRSITVSAEVAAVGMELARAALQAQPLFSKQLTEIMFRERGWVASDAFMKDVVGSIAGSAQQKKKR